jgi:5'-nucleotidase
MLLTNDDGILAPGLSALYEAVKDFGHVDVVAPATPQSAMGHAISVQVPLVVQRIHVNHAFHGWSVAGRPADCVKLAMVKLLDQRPDFVLSGINAGANTGINVLYSGTVAAAAEGAFFGVPSVAFSLTSSQEMDFEAASLIVREIFQSYAASQPPAGSCLNVNLPPLDAGMPHGVRVAPTSTKPMREFYHQQSGSDGQSVFILDGEVPDPTDCPDTDHEATHENYVAVTPLKFEVTDQEAMQRVAEVQWPRQFKPSQ